MASLREKLKSEDFESMHKKFDTVLTQLSKKWDAQIIKSINIPSSIVFTGLKKEMEDVLLELKKEIRESKRLDMKELIKEAPDWYKNAPDEVSIKNEVVVLRNQVERKEDVGILQALLGTFFSSIVDFFSKLQKSTYTARMIPEHYATPQSFIMIDPTTMKPLDPKNIGFGTMQQVYNTSLAGRASEVGIKGANTIGDGQATVATAGTRFQLPDVACSRVLIQAHPDNTGDMVVGGAAVVANSATRRGLALFSSQWSEFSVNNLSKLWIDSTASGDKINYIYEYIS